MHIQQKMMTQNALGVENTAKKLPDRPKPIRQFNVFAKCCNTFRYQKLQFPSTLNSAVPSSAPYTCTRQSALEGCAVTLVATQMMR